MKPEEQRFEIEHSDWEYLFVVDSLRELADTFDKTEVMVVKVSSQFIQQITLRRSRRF